MRLTHLGVYGLGAKDLELDLPEALFVAGPNGSGKTMLLRGVDLMVNGAGANLERFMRAGSKEIRVYGEFTDLAGTKKLERSWMRKKDGGLSQEIIGSMLGDCLNRGIGIAESAIARDLGAWAIAWSPRDLIDLKPAELRARLVGMFCGSIEAPPMPPWARREKGDTVDTFVSRTLKGAIERREIIAGKRSESGMAAAAKHEALIDTAEMTAALEKLEARLEIVVRADELEAKLSTPDPDVVYTERDFDIAQGVLDRSLALEPVRDEIGALQIERDAEARKVHGREKLTIAQLNAAIAAAESVHDRVKAADLLASEAVHTAEVRAEVEASPLLDRCAECGADLVARAEAELRERLKILDAARALETKACGDREAAAVVLNTWNARLRSLQAQNAVAGFDARIEALKTKLADHPSVEMARAELKKIDGALVLERIDRAALEAELEDLGPIEDMAALEKEIEIREARLEAALHENAACLGRVGAASIARGWVLKYDGELREAEAEIDQLRAAQAAIVAAIQGATEPALSAALGRAVKVDLGDRLCRIIADGIDVVTLSDGETIDLLIGGLIALGAGSRAPWRPLIYDRIEALDRKRRAEVMQRVMAAIGLGRVDQAILAGCPDTVQLEAGWSLWPQ